MQHCRDAVSAPRVPDTLDQGCQRTFDRPPRAFRGSATGVTENHAVTERCKSSAQPLRPRSGDVGNRVVCERQVACAGQASGTEWWTAFVTCGTHRPRCARMRRMTCGSSIQAQYPASALCTSWTEKGVNRKSVRNQWHLLKEETPDCTSCQRTLASRVGLSADAFSKPGFRFSPE
jgi:hypothetical protein